MFAGYDIANGDEVNKRNKLFGNNLIMLEVIVGVIPPSGEVLRDPFRIKDNHQPEDQKNTKTKREKPQHTKLITYL